MTELQGFGKIHDFNEYDIDEYVLPTGGNYRIGITVGRDRILEYVGRTTDLRARLKNHRNDLSWCDCFQILYEPDEVHRYLKECHDYHYFGGNKKLENKIHPAKPPEGLDLICPFCRQ